MKLAIYLFKRSLRSTQTLAVLATFLLGNSCSVAEEVNHTPSDMVHAKEYTSNDTFSLKPDPDLGAIQKTETVDVNLGATPEAFVRILWKQLTGKVAEQAWVVERANRLSTESAPRRIDLALQLAQEADVQPQWAYSDPWAKQIPLEDLPVKVLERDVGAVFMFFFTSPERPNGGPGWSADHAPGMFKPQDLLTIEGYEQPLPNDKIGYYHPKNAGFWYREFKDAQWAGLDFLLLNVYGPDLDFDNMAGLRSALLKLSDEDGERAVKLGLFDDTWTWGKPWFGPYWNFNPDSRDIERTASLLYESKWRPFFQQVPRERWYLVQNRPFISFYNSGTVQNRNHFSPVLARMKELFKIDFGVEPFVAMDSEFLSDNNIQEYADSCFVWYTLDKKDRRSTFNMKGVEHTHAMVRWDSIAREAGRKERMFTSTDVLHKDDSLLKQLLDHTRETDILVLATWNDLGEGTGINRVYDYYWDREWRKPNHFMDLIRRSQQGELLLDK